MIMVTISAILQNLMMTDDAIDWVTVYLVIIWEESASMISGCAFARILTSWSHFKRPISWEVHLRAVCQNVKALPLFRVFDHLIRNQFPIYWLIWYLQGLVAILFANGTIDDNIWTHIKDFVETQTWNNWEERICQSFCNFNILCPKCLIISLIFGHKFLKSNEIWPARLCTGQSKKTTGFQEFFNTISQNHCWERIVNDIFTKELESLKVKFAGKGGKAGKGRKGGFS